ncbi:MAG: SGNH/GDSL hydrolase family protein [Actinomycetes bacterium]
MPSLRGVDLVARGRASWLLLPLGLVVVALSALALRAPAPQAVKAPSLAADTPTSTSNVATIPPRVAFLGDSYVGGSAMGGRKSKGWPAIVSAKFGWKPQLFTAPGIGYTVGGASGRSYAARLGRVIAAAPDIVIIEGSRSDTDAAAVRVASAAAYQRIKKELPNTRVVVIGPAWGNGRPPASILAIRDAVKASAKAAGLPFIDPIRDDWFAFPYSSLIGGDGVNPTNGGHVRMAALLAADLTRLGLT